MIIRSLSFVILSHGIVAAVYAFVFFLEAINIYLPLLSLKAQHPNFVSSEYSKVACLFVAVSILTFSIYEIFFFPKFIKNLNDQKMKKKIKYIFVGYHIPWSFMIIYVSLIDDTVWNAWLSVIVMIGFTIWGILADSKK